MATALKVQIPTEMSLAEARRHIVDQVVARMGREHCSAEVALEAVAVEMGRNPARWWRIFGVSVVTDAYRNSDLTPPAQPTRSIGLSWREAVKSGRVSVLDLACPVGVTGIHKKYGDLEKSDALVIGNFYRRSGETLEGKAKRWLRAANGMKEGEKLRDAIEAGHVGQSFVEFLSRQAGQRAEATA